MAQMSFSTSSFAMPAWAAEELTPEKLMPGGAKLVASAFPYLDAVQVDVGAAGAAVDATSVPVAITRLNPISTKADPVIPVEAVLDFGGDKYATLTAAVNLAATSLTVRALVTALVDADVATYIGTVMRKPVASGILVGRTFTERGAGTGFGTPDVATPDDELFLTAFAVDDALINADVTLLKHGTLIYEDKLPGWAGLSTTAKTAIRTRYRCIASAG